MGARLSEVETAAVGVALSGEDYYSVIIALRGTAGSAGFPLGGGWHAEQLPNLSDRVLAGRTFRAFLALTLALRRFFPQPLCFVPASITLGLYLQAEVGHESAAIHLGAEVMQIAQFVVDRLGSVLLSQEATSQLVQHRLSMFHGDRPQVARRESALVVLEPWRDDQRLERHGLARGVL